MILTFVLQSTLLPLLPGLSARVAHAEEPDVVAPTVSLTAPTNGSTVTGNITVSTDASDDVGVVGVQLKLDGVPLGSELSTAPYQLDWDSTTVTAASHTLSAVARDAAGNSTESSAVTFTVQHPPDTTSPTVAMTNPTEGMTVSGNVALAAEATDNVGIANVRFKVDGAFFGPALTAPPFVIDWDTTVQSNGSHTLIVYADDAAGNSTLSTSVHVTVDNSSPPPPPPDVDTTPPTVAITSPAVGTVLEGVVPVTAEATDNVGVVGVQLKVDGTALGPEITSPPYRIDWDSTALINGPHTFSATARDAAGNIGTSSSLSIDILNDNEATIHNVLNTNATSGYNTSSGYNTPSPVVIGTGEVSAGNILSNDINKNVISFNGQEVSLPNGNGPVAVPLQNVTVSNNNRATVVNTVTSTVESGHNQANQNRYSVITTGNANVYSAIMNTVNTNLVGTNFYAYVKDIAGTQQGNIDFLGMMLETFGQANGQGMPTNLEIKNNNQGLITNDLTITASTGGNSASADPYASCSSMPFNYYPPSDTRFDARYINHPKEGDDFYRDDDMFAGVEYPGPWPDPYFFPYTCAREATIATGGINASTNVVNMLNTNVVGSNWLFSAVNVFGDFIGDIILPGQGVIESLFDAQPGSLNVEVDNQADVASSIDVVGDTGNNSTINNRRGSLDVTGDSRLRTSVSTTVNQTIVGSNLYSFVPHIFGTWDGTVINSPADGYFGRDARIDPSGSMDVNNVNSATIKNRIIVNATSGLNKAEGNRYSVITTGDIQASTNLVNVANTNIVGSNWFTGYFNLFGSWKGNVVYAYPDLQIGSNAAATAGPGDLIEYALSYGNIGLAPGGNVVIQDQIPDHSEVVSVLDGGQVRDGMVTWNLGRLSRDAANGSVRFTVRVKDDLPVGTTDISNAAMISTTTPEEVTTNNRSSAVTSVTVLPPPPPTPPAAPQLEIAKNNDAAGVKRPGEDVTYTIEVTNTGNVAVQDVFVRDALSDQNGATLFNKDFTVATLDPGMTMEISYAVRIGATTADGVYTNTAVAQATYNGSVVRTSEAHSPVTVQRATEESPTPGSTPAPTPDVWSPSNPTISPPAETSPAEWPPANVAPAPKKSSKPQLTVVQTHNAKGTLKGGSKIKFQVRISNSGGQTVKNISLANTFKNGVKYSLKWKIGTLKPAEQVLLSYTFTLSKQAPSGKYTSTSVATGKLSNGKTIKSNNSATTFRVAKSSSVSNSIIKKASALTVSKAVLRGTKTRTATGGFFFRDDQGRPISAFAYASLNSLRLVDLLSDSRDPVDQSFVNAFYSGLSLVGKRDKTGKLITYDDIVRDLRSAPQFRTIYGK